MRYSFHSLAISTIALAGLAACAPAPSAATAGAPAPSVAAACHPESADTASSGAYRAPQVIRLLPPPVPLPGSDVRGQTYLTAVFVDSSGAVVPDSTRITPEPRDRQFAQNFAATLARQRYRPALSDGCPAGAWVKLSYSFTG